MKVTVALILSFVAIATAEWNKLMEGKFYQGDMQLSPDQVMQIKKNAFGATSFRKWPKSGNNVNINYFIENSVQGATQLINQAVADIEAASCLRFRRVLDDNSVRATPHLRFVTGGGCSSPVGRAKGRLRTNLRHYQGNHIELYHDPNGGTCWHKGTIIHEVMHSLGFAHEQSRPDRNQFVTINFHNIKPNAITGQSTTHNFDIDRRVDSLNHAYDYRSIMHYTKDAFGGGDTTITTKDPAYQDIIGQSEQLSRGDIAQLNTLYNC